MAAVVEYGSELVEHPGRTAGVSAIGVDETAFLRANAGRSTVFATGIVDLQRGKLIDIVAGRSRKVLADWLIDQPEGWVAGIQVAALDPFRGYGSALSWSTDAVRVLDAFHVVRLGCRLLTRRVQQQTYGHRGPAASPSLASRVFCPGAPNPSDTGWARLFLPGRRHTHPPRPCRPHAALSPAVIAHTRSPPLHFSSLLLPSVRPAGAPSPPGAPNSWPSSAPAELATDPPKPSTC